jgi:hypothetical protein
MNNANRTGDPEQRIQKNIKKISQLFVLYYYFIFLDGPTQCGLLDRFGAVCAGHCNLVSLRRLHKRAILGTTAIIPAMPETPRHDADGHFLVPRFPACS